MERYEIVIARVAQQQMRRVPLRDRQRIIQAIETLADNPRPPQSEKLAGREGYRLRCGDYRIIYTIHDRLLRVLVIRVGHRREVYRGGM